MSAVRWRRADGHRNSWHLLPPDEVITYCGRTPPHPAEYLPELPGNERTCERCAVLALNRRAESAHVARHLADIE